MILFKNTDGHLVYRYVSLNFFSQPVDFVLHVETLLGYVARWGFLSDRTHIRQLENKLRVFL